MTPDDLLAELRQAQAVFDDFADLSKPPTLELSTAFHVAAGRLGGAIPSIIAALESAADLRAENERLKAELARVAPFLANHGVAGYRFGPSQEELST